MKGKLITSLEEFSVIIKMIRCKKSSNIVLIKNAIFIVKQLEKSYTYFDVNRICVNRQLTFP